MSIELPYFKKLSFLWKSFAARLDIMFFLS